MGQHGECHCDATDSSDALGEELLGRSLAALESKLDPQRFFRANRQQIINLELIRGVDPGVGGRLHVELNDGREIQISRRQARQFRNRTLV
jgi:two-component system LytT family response regulator